MPGSGGAVACPIQVLPPEGLLRKSRAGRYDNLPMEALSTDYFYTCDVAGAHDPVKAAAPGQAPGAVAWVPTVCWLLLLLES